MKNNRKIYLVRHCEPDLPKKSSLCLGRKDVPLSNRGLKQAENLRNFLSKLNIETIYSSPLVRALKTAEIISNGDIQYEIVDNFTELDVGKWDGMSFDEIKEKYPKEYEERGKNFDDYIIEEGESLSACKNRALKALSKVVNESKGNIAVISHAGVIRTILSDIMNISIEEIFSYKLEYGSICILRYNNNIFNVKIIGLKTENLSSEEEGYYE